MKEIPLPQEVLDALQAGDIEVSERQVKEIEAVDEVRKLLAEPDIKDFGTFKYGQVEIRHRRYFPWEVRRFLEKSSKTVRKSENPVTAEDETVYTALSKLCLDEPWTKPETWKVIDARTRDGRVYMIFEGIVTKIGKREQNIAAFQQK